MEQGKRKDELKEVGGQRGTKLHGVTDNGGKKTGSCTEEDEKRVPTDCWFIDLVNVCWAVPAYQIQCR